MSDSTPETETAQHRQLAQRAIAAGDWAAAARHLDELTRRQPDSADAWSDLGVALRRERRFPEALGCARRALGLDPGHRAARRNLGNSLKDLGRLEEAVEAHRAALAAEPDDAELLHNLAIALIQARRFTEALQVLDRALPLSRENGAVVFERALVHLRRGHYQEGWQDYESRWSKQRARQRSFAVPKWNGAALGGRYLLVHPEQGFGDCILAARFLPLVAQRGGKVLLACWPELRRLFARLPGVEALVEESEGEKLVAAHCPMMSLPGILGITPAAVPSPPQLHVPEDARAKARSLLPPQAGALRIGIVWSGNPAFEENHLRACGLPNFLPLLQVPGVRLFSLQMGTPRTELQALPSPSPVTDLSTHLGDFADTAAFLEQLDLVVMTDSAVVHLGGALGRPVWAALQYVPFWIYDTGSERTSWYPSVRLFRQPRWGAWDEVFARIRAALETYARAAR